MINNLLNDDIGEINKIQSNVKFQCTWKINNFSDIMNKTGVFKSPMISTKTKPEYHFKFVIVRSCRTKEYFNMALRSYNNTALEIRCSFSIIDAINSKKTSTYVYNLNDLGWGVRIDKISKAEEVLINDEITLLCELEIDMNSKCNKQPSDVNIIIDNNKFFVHKDILANSSNVFAAMFQHEMKENQENLIKIEDIEYDIFNVLLQFIYLKKDVSIDNDDRINLLAAADKYAIEGLKNVCEDKLCKNITLTNVFEYLNVAHMYILNKLKKETIAFIKLHKSQLVEKKLIHSITDLPQDVLIEVISAI